MLLFLKIHRDLRDRAQILSIEKFRFHPCLVDDFLNIHVLFLYNINLTLFMHVWHLKIKFQVISINESKKFIQIMELVFLTIN